MQFSDDSDTFTLGRLLAKYSLRLPLSSHTQTDSARPSTVTTAIAAAPIGEPQAAACDISYGYRSVQAYPSYINLDPKSFVVPADADLRLKRFMSVWAVSAVEPSAGGVPVAADAPRLMLACELAGGSDD